MTLAEFVNRIVSTLPGVVFVEISGVTWRTRFAFAHHVYVAVNNYGDIFEVWEVMDEFGKEEQTAFSRRIEGMLNGWKRNEAGEMVKPVEVDCG